MRKTIFTIALLVSMAMQAQVLHVNNTNDTYQSIDTKKAKEVTFDEEKHIVTFEMLDGMIYMFNTDKVEDVSLKGSKTTELTYDSNPAISFNANDKNNYNEIVETITEEETEENDYGDFVEHYSVSRKVTINYTADGPVVTTVPTSIDGISYKIKGNDVTITSTKKKVVYTVQGKCDNGSLKIYSENKFQIILNGIELTNPVGPAINIQTGKTVYFTIYNNTTNSLCDGATYDKPALDEEDNEEDQKGTLFSEGQLIFNGTGTLNVTSLGGHAICSDDYIRVRSGNINILQAAKDGFHTNDKFIISRTKTDAPYLRINSTADGIDCGKGEVIIEAGKLEIISGGEGIKVEYEENDPLVTPNATIRGGYISINTKDEKSSAIKTTGDFTLTDGVIEATVNGDGSKILNCDGNIYLNGGKITGFAKGTSNSDDTLSGGIKCEGNIDINETYVAIECTQSNTKGINCNGDITVNSGDVTIITNAVSNNEQSSQAIESDYITINGGKVVLSSYDNTVSTLEITVNDGILNSYSKNGIAFDAEINQNGGWIVIQEK